MHFLFFALFAAAADPRVALAGTWKGESLCTPVRPACRDEIAVYHITIPDKPGVIEMQMNKVIDGKEVEMGGITVYQVSPDARALNSEYTYNGNHLKWSFKRIGDAMRGTLIDVPTQAVIRNIHVKKQ